MSVPYFRRLKCHSIAFHDVPDGEYGDKIVLPPSALQEIQQLQIPTPLLFELRNGATEHEALYNFCGVLEFSAPDDTVSR